jgi:hypothetical protein
MERKSPEDLLSNGAYSEAWFANMELRGEGEDESKSLFICINLKNE